MRRFRPMLIAIVLGALLVLQRPVRADMGPNFGPTGNVFINLNFHGQRPKGKFRFLLLSSDLSAGRFDLTPSRGWTDGTDNGEGIPGLQDRLSRDSHGVGWVYCKGNFEKIEGNTIFCRYLRSNYTGGFPRTIRLAVYFPDLDKTFLTNPVDTSRRGTNSFEATLEPDGTGTLVLTNAGSWVEEHYVLEMLAALAGTLIIELAVVLLWIAATQRRAPARRVLLIAIAGNLITVPAVWAASMAGKIYFDLLAAALIYLAAEVGAVIFEATLYAWLGRFGVVRALWLSFTANMLSFLCGCCLVGFY